MRSESFLIKFGRGRFLDRLNLLALDAKLHVGDTVEIKIKPMPFHGILGLSKPQMMYRLLKVLGDNIEITESSANKISFKKINYGRNYINPSSAKILLGIVSGGNNLENIKSNVSNASNSVKNLRIVISGSKNLHSDYNFPHDVEIIDPSNYSHGGRFLISQKKNDILKYADGDFDYAIILHDHYVLDDTFWSVFEKVDTNFDFLITRKRHIEHPFDTMHGEKEKLVLPFDCRSIMPMLYPTTKVKSEFFHMNGGVIIGSRHAFSKISLDNRLGWSELEDVDFSTRAYFEGLVTKYDEKLCVFSCSSRLKPVKNEPIQFIKQYIKSLFLKVIK